MGELLMRGLVLAAVLGGATGLGLLWRRRAGQARAVTAGEVLTEADLGTPLGTEATFVQFSSPVCAPCRAVRRVLDGVVAERDGLGHVEVDAVERLDLARRLNIMRTPTVLVLESGGRVVSRISGVMTAEQARAAVPRSIRSRI